MFKNTLRAVLGTILLSVVLSVFSCPAVAQQGGGVVAIPPITPGDCAEWKSLNQLEDATIPCGGSGAGISQLTGDVTAGPGTGSQPSTLATVNTNVGTFGSSTQCVTVTVNAKGLVTAASQASCSGGSGGTPGGSNTQVQYNNSSAFGGVSGVISNGTSMQFTDGDLLIENSAVSGGSAIHAPATSGHTDFTLPPVSDTLVGLTNTQTLTNKNLTSPTISALTVTGSLTATGLVTNADLANSSVTIGSTAVSLGASATTVAGLTLTSPTINGGALSGTFSGAHTYSGNLTFSGSNAYGTPTSITLTAATGLPISTGVSGLGTGVATALGTAVSGTGAICLASGSSCSGGASVSVTSASNNIVVNPSPGTGTFTVGATYLNNAQTGTTYTVGSGSFGTDNSVLLTGNNASAQTFTFPATTTTGFGSGYSTTVCEIGAGLMTLSSASTFSPVAAPTLAQGQCADISSLGGSVYNISSVSLPIMAANTVLGNSTGSAALPAAIATTGTGSVVRATSPTLVTPALGTPSAVVLTNGTGLVASTGTTATGTPSSTTYLRGDNTWSTPAGGSGGGMFNYSDNGVTITANTYFAPVGGGGAPQTTEAAVSIPSPSATTVTNLSVSISGTLGVASTGFTVTLQKNGTGQTLTCTFNPSSATACTDLTHSVTIAQGDVIDWKVVTAGTVVGTPTITIAANNGTSNVGVTSVTCGSGLSGGTITTTGTCAVAATSLVTGTSASLTGPNEIYVCTSTCTITPPTPVAGYQFCVEDDATVSTVITMASIASSFYQKAVAPGTANGYGSSAGAMTSGGAVGDMVCLIGRDSTHYLVGAYGGVWTNT